MKGRTLMPVGIFVVLLAAAIPAQAQNTGFFIGTGVGRSTYESWQVTASIPPQSVRVKDTSTAVRVFGGYRPLRYLAVEAGVVSYGNLKEPIGSDTSTPNSFEASYGGWDAALVFAVPLADDAFDLFAKVGVARQRYDTLISDPVDPNFAVDSKTSDSQTSSLFGVGAQFNVGSDKNIGIRLEYNTYDVALLSADQSNVMASFVYRFSRSQ